MPESSTHKITSNLTFDSVPGLLEQSRGWFAPGESSIVVDLSSAGRTDSAGIALLLEWIEMAQKLGLQLRFTQLPSQMREFIQANDLDKLFNQYSN